MRTTTWVNYEFDLTPQLKSGGKESDAEGYNLYLRVCNSFFISLAIWDYICKCSNPAILENSLLLFSLWPSGIQLRGLEHVHQFIATKMLVYRSHFQITYSHLFQHYQYYLFYLFFNKISIGEGRRGEKRRGEGNRERKN